MRCSAFTLIEVMAVVAVMGLLAAATMWSLADDARRSSRADVIDRIAHADRTARLEARRLGQPTWLRMDLDRQQVWRVAQPSDRDAQWSHTLALPAGYRVDRVVTAIDAQPLETESGAVDIAYSTRGCSGNFALHLQNKEEEGWMVFAGLTGQMTWMKDENEVDNLFALLTTGGADAP